MPTHELYICTHPTSLMETRVLDCVLQKVLISLAASFLYYAHHFKVYSSFCASHSKAQKLLDPG